MNFGEFYNLTESEKDGVFANVSKRLDDLEKRIDSAAKPGDVPKYTCVPSQSEENDILIIIDVEKGTMAGRLNTRGRLISHPLVYGDKVAFAIQRVCIGHQTLQIDLKMVCCVLVVQLRTHITPVCPS